MSLQVPPVQNAEPGWMAGEIRGHTGWFPESYVEPIDSNASTDSTFMQQDSVEKRTLEYVTIYLNDRCILTELLFIELSVAEVLQKFPKMCLMQDLSAVKLL